MADPTGKGQGLAIDNLSFSASQLPLLTAQPTANGVEVLWPLTFTGFTLQQNSNLGQGAGWTDLVLPVSTNGEMVFGNGASHQRRAILPAEALIGVRTRRRPGLHRCVHLDRIVRREEASSPNELIWISD